MASTFMEAFKSGMTAQDYSLKTIANNMANANTTGFKSQRADFQDLMYTTLQASGALGANSVETPQALQYGLGTQLSGVTTDFTEGPLLQTGNPINLAISGQGFFQVEMNGTPYYTRDGSFMQSATGLLVTSNGYPLMPNITIPEGATAVTITQAGFVSAILPGQTNAQQIGQIQLAMFANPAGLTRAGNNLYQANNASGNVQTAAPQQNGAGSILAGFLEGSNVNIIDQMVGMIMAQRTFEANAKGIQTGDSLLGIVNNLPSA